MGKITNNIEHEKYWILVFWNVPITSMLGMLTRTLYLKYNLITQRMTLLDTRYKVLKKIVVSSWNNWSTEASYRVFEQFNCKTNWNKSLDNYFDLTTLLSTSYVVVIFLVSNT